MRMAIGEDEQFPVYSLAPVAPEILAEHPDAGFEVDQALVDEFRQAEKAWYAVQARLGKLFLAEWRREFGG